ncbi:MAG: carboxypeptidase-like regulatory domain-containing protein [Bacteroidetes bacterium]|nr:carboxypeptidase-like regulatory domain-containing protein [Bacteroidota bacterium]
MLKKLPLLILLLLIVCICATAQTITGTVTDATSKETMPFVTVSVEGTTNATTTDINGKFTLTNVKTDDVLLFSFVGYTFQKVKVAGQQTITVKMQSASKELGEVVVTALGVTRQKRELGYSTEKIKGDEINKSNSPNLLNAITGKAAGVIISNPDGVDGGTTRIRIRGNNSINGNNSPLIVVDGVPMQNTAGMTDIGRGQDWGSAINNINMNDVESVGHFKRRGCNSIIWGKRR